MTEVNLLNQNKPRWPIRLLTPLLLLTILGFMPWEQVFPIEIKSPALLFLTSSSFGFIFFIVLIAVTLIFVMNNYKRLSGVAMLLLPLCLLPLVFCLFISLYLPAFNWLDQSFYRNGDDYIIVQQFEDFVTSSVTPPRIERTKSPYGMVRIIEERDDLGKDDPFNGEHVTYKGKVWTKQSTRN